MKVGKDVNDQVDMDVAHRLRIATLERVEHALRRRALEHVSWDVHDQVDRVYTAIRSA